MNPREWQRTPLLLLRSGDSLQSGANKERPHTGARYFWPQSDIWLFGVKGYSPPKLLKVVPSEGLKSVKIYPWYEKRFCFWWSRDDSYWAWVTIFNGIHDRHAPRRQVKIRDQSLPRVTPRIRHLVSLRYKTLLKARKPKNDELWTQYRGLKNWATEEVRRAKCSYYSYLFDQAKDCKSY